jgi:hypothetical protein
MAAYSIISTRVFAARKPDLANNLTKNLMSLKRMNLLHKFFGHAAQI